MGLTRKHNLCVYILNTQATWAGWPKWLEREFTSGRSMIRARTLPLDFPCLGLGNLAVSQHLGGMAVSHRKGATAER
ncbi:hypothetical protein CSKR_104619 [Clonorchis sinensis]|uniref:Uncharacterized protein n=1 Tax=Clonorchis sinensis TaxID=79923 RepID=A0A3R7EQV1_CLOSI|nr:hypothetical protein CSKR_104619 [Clonorchis sinensis]